MHLPNHSNSVLSNHNRTNRTQLYGTISSIVFAALINSLYNELNSQEQTTLQSIVRGIAIFLGLQMFTYCVIESTNDNSSALQIPLLQGHGIFRFRQEGNSTNENNPSQAFRRSINNLSAISQDAGEALSESNASTQPQP